VLHQAIARLPAGERELLALVSIDGLTPKGHPGGEETTVVHLASGGVATLHQTL
jgi:hypothetical protein